ncbi:MAG: hypothetical protein Kow0013_25880 [Pararhodobacter sp.]
MDGAEVEQAPRNVLETLVAEAASEGLTGNGCHAHVSVWDLEGKINACAGKGAGQIGVVGLSERGGHFPGGIMNHAEALAALTNPTVNSDKRINAPRPLSRATGAPNTVTWTGNNRTPMVRVPAPGRFELRLPDGAVNPYLLQAVIIDAGLSGIRSRADPGPRHDNDMYVEGNMLKTAPRPPLNTLDAVRAFDADTELKAMPGDAFSASCVKMQHREWNSFVSHFSQWEKDQTLDI